MADTVKPLDGTDTTQIMIALQTWINDQDILPSRLYMEYINGLDSYCIKCNGGAIISEDILGNFSAEVSFSVYYYTNAVPDGTGEIFKPLDDLIAWIRKNKVIGLDIGDRRTPNEIMCTKAPTDLSGPDEDGNTTFFCTFFLSYDENIE